MGQNNQDIHHRRSIRLRGYDYGEPGTYFVTICVQHGRCLFGDVLAAKMGLSDAGWVIERVWKTLPDAFPGLAHDEYRVMPNHLHGLLVVERPLPGWVPDGRTYLVGPDNRPAGPKPGTIGQVMQVFKTDSTFEYSFGVRHYEWPPYAGRLWQRNYYEHIVRNEDDLARIRAYIQNNPARWSNDCENPDRAEPSEAFEWPFEGDEPA